MKIEMLFPQPIKQETFKRNRQRFVPESSGCYVLATFSDVVLYVGLAKNLRIRMNNHLDNEEKTAPTIAGRATYFYWLECLEIEKVERTWMNIHIQHEGILPLLNRVYSPVST